MISLVNRMRASTAMDFSSQGCVDGFLPRPSLSERLSACSFSQLGAVEQVADRNNLPVAPSTFAGCRRRGCWHETRCQ